MWQILLDGAEVLGAKMRGVNPISSMLQVYLQLEPSVQSRLRRTQAPLSQAFLQRVQWGQSLYRQTLMFRLQALLGQGLLGLYRLREQLMLRHLVSRALAQSARFPLARMQALQSPEYLRQERGDLFRLPLLRMSVLLALLALQPLARLRSQVHQTLQSQVLAELALLALLLPLALLALLPLGLAALVQSARYLLLGIHQLPQQVLQALARLAQYLSNLASQSAQQEYQEQDKLEVYQLRPTQTSHSQESVAQDKSGSR